MTEIDITPHWSEVNRSGYYVYIHRRASDLTEFYVGKGSNKRAWFKNKSECRTDFWINTAKKHGVIVEICQCDMTEDEAFLLEMWLIAKFRHEGARLCNLTDGGDGVVGYVMTAEVYDKILTHAKSQSIPVFCENGMRFDSVMESVRWLTGSFGLSTASPGNVARAARRGVRAYGMFWSLTGEDFPDGESFDEEKFDHMRGDKVIMDGHLVFRCISDAARHVGRGGARTLIALCCNGKRGAAYGHTWSFYRGDF